MPKEYDAIYAETMGLVYDPETNQYLPASQAQGTEEPVLAGDFLPDVITEHEGPAETRTERHRAAILGAQGPNPWHPWEEGDKKPGFFGGLISGIQDDIPRLGVQLGDAFDTNWGPLGGQDDATHEDRIHLIDEINRRREERGEWTDLRDVFDDESFLQNWGDFTLWFRETFGRSFPILAAGAAVGAAAPAEGAAALVAGGATATVASYPFILSEMMNRNYEETTQDGEDPDYNAVQTMGLALPAAAVEGLSQAIVPIRLLNPVLRNLASRMTGEAAQTTMSQEARRGLLSTVTREFFIGAGTGATEETLQAGFERLAAPGVEVLGPDALEEYAWSALGGALMEGPLGSGISGVNHYVNPALTSRAIQSRATEAVENDVVSVDDLYDDTPTFLPLSTREVTSVLDNAKNEAFTRERNRIRGHVFQTPQDARAYLRTTGNMVTEILTAVTPPEVGVGAMTEESIAALPDQEAINLAEIAMAAGTMKLTGYGANNFRGMSLSEVFNTGNEQVNQDRKFLSEFEATQRDPGNPDQTVSFRPFSVEQLSLMTPRVSNELANYLRYTQKTPDRTDMDTTNIESAVGGLSKQANAMMDQDQQRYSTVMDQIRKDQSREILSRENPVLAQIEDALKAQPEGAPTIHPSSLGNIKGKAQSAYDNFVKKAEESGVDPRTLLNSSAWRVPSEIMRRVPRAKLKEMDKAYKELDSVLDEIKAGKLLDSIGEAFATPDTNLYSVDAQDVRLSDITWTNFQQAKIAPSFSNYRGNTSALVNQAFAGPGLKKFRDNLERDIRAFETSLDARARVTTLTYAMNNMDNLSVNDGTALFHVLREMDFWSPQELAKMYDINPKTIKNSLMDLDANVQSSLVRDLGKNKFSEVITSEAFSQYMTKKVIIHAVREAFYPNFMRAQTSMSRAANGDLKNLLGNTWDSYEVRRGIEEASHKYYQSSIRREVRRNTTEGMNKEGRGVVDLIASDQMSANPNTVALQGSNNFDAMFKSQKSWRTLQRQAKDFPALATLVDAVRSRNTLIEKIMLEFQTDFADAVPFNNPEKVKQTERALHRLDIMNATGQSLENRTDDNRLLYKAWDPSSGELRTFALTPEETAAVDNLTKTLKKVPLMYKVMTQESISDLGISVDGRTLGDVETTSKEVYQWIENATEELSAMTVESPAKAKLQENVDRAEVYANTLEFSEVLLDPSRPYFPHLRSSPNTMFQAFYFKNSKGIRVLNPDAGPRGDKYLKMVVEIPVNKKNKPSVEGLAAARARVQKDMVQLYQAHYPDLNIVQYEETTPVDRSSIKRGELTELGFEATIEDMGHVLRATDLSSKDMQKVIKDLRSRRSQRMSAEGRKGSLMSYVRMTTNIGGYSQDYVSVLGEYLSNAPWVLANDRYADVFKRYGDILNNTTRDLSTDTINEHFPEEQRAFLKKQWEYMTEPANDLSLMRQLNFFYALGFQLSTAFLNLFTIPTVVYPSLSSFRTSVLGNAKTMAKMSAAAAEIIHTAEVEAGRNNTDIKGRTIELRYSEASLRKTLRKHFPKEKVETIMGVTQNNMVHLQQSIMEESFTRGRLQSVHDQYQGKVQSALGRFKDKTLMFAGFPLHMAERYTRLSAFLSYLDLMVSNDGTVNTDAINSYLTSNKDNALIGTILENRKITDASDLRVLGPIAVQMVQDTHGVYDKTGRGAIQRGWAGSIIFPFMTYPLTVLEFLGNSAFHTGVQGKQTFALAMTMFFVFAGINGFPGAETYKELFEFIMQYLVPKDKRRIVNADERLNWYLTQELGLEPEVARILTNGSLASMNMDMSRRIGIPLPFENAVSFMANPDSSYAQQRITGIPGRLLADTGAGRFDRLAPVAAQNIFRSLDWASSGVETTRGVQYVGPEEIRFDEVALRALGIQPLSVSERNLNSYTWRSLEEQYIVPARRALYRDLTEIGVNIHYSQEAGNVERTAELTDAFNDRIFDFYVSMAAHNTVPPPRLMTSIRRQVAREITQRVDPGAFTEGERPGTRQPEFDAPEGSRWGENEFQLEDE